MDQIFDSQFIAMQAAFAGDGIGIEIAYSPNGHPDYIYQTDRLLVDLRYPGIVGLIEKALRGDVPPADKGEQPRSPDLRVLSLENLANGYLSVPDALDLIDAELSRERGRDTDDAELDDPGDYQQLARSRGYTPVSPVHALYLTNGSSTSGRICPATEPEVPWCCCDPDQGSHDCPPCPPPAAGRAGAGVLIGVCDTGLLEFGPDDPQPPWLANTSSGTVLANGTAFYDPLGPLLAPVPPIPPGLYDIPRYTGHGTFVAGVASCVAPGAEVTVFGDIVQGGGVLETTIVDKLMALLGANRVPNVVNLSAGGYTRHDFMLLSFTALGPAGDVKLVAAAGNDATSRRFWPAAFSWVVGVGALGADRRDRAWFSNYGRWVDVYAPGEGLVNAYATGVYSYQEPPKRPARQIFHGMARWSGTSFSTPLIVGRIAAQMTSVAGTISSAWAAADAVLAEANDPQNYIPGVGPAFLP
jgi:hypothetical protein